VVVHEFGHSFGGLTDEYFHEGDAAAASEHATEVEPWEQNVTNLKDFSGKWSHLIKKGTPMPTPTKLQKKYPVGLYEGGAYLAKGMYRASYNCRMRTNDTPDFCPACRLGLDKILDYNLPPRRK
jgi:igA peptidase M64